MTVNIHTELLAWLLDEIEEINLTILHDSLTVNGNVDANFIRQLCEEKKDKFRQLRKKFFSWNRGVQIPGFPSKESEEENKFNEWVNK